MRELAISLAMFLQTVVAPAPPTAPGACLVTRVDPNDGSALAVCLDGPDLVKDPDGQLFLNPVNPMRLPGWEVK